MNNVDKQSILEASNGFNLKEHFFIIKKRILVLVIITILTTSFGIIKSIFLTAAPIYQSSTSIIINADSTLMNTLLVLIKDPSVLGKVASDIGSNVSAESLDQKINASSINNSQVVVISVSDNNPIRAADIANMTAKVYKDELPNLIGFKEVKLLTKAKVNPYPINSSSKMKTIMIYFGIGLVVGIILIYFLNLLDDSIGSYDNIEDIVGLPVLGNVPKMNKNNMKNSKNMIEVVIRGETIDN